MNLNGHAGMVCMKKDGMNRCEWQLADAGSHAVMSHATGVYFSLELRLEGEGEGKGD